MGECQATHSRLDSSTNIVLFIVYKTIKYTWSDQVAGCKNVIRVDCFFQTS